MGKADLIDSRCLANNRGFLYTAGPVNNKDVIEIAGLIGYFV